MKKLRVRIGVCEVEYEGESDFLPQDLVKLLRDIKEVFPEAALEAIEKPVKSVPAKLVPTGLEGVMLTTSTVAQRTGASTGPDLAKAALSKICLVDGKVEAKRKEILEEMQSAKAFYTANYSSNLSKILKRLVGDGVFNETGTDTYALSAEARAQVAVKLNEQAAT